MNKTQCNKSVLKTQTSTHQLRVHKTAQTKINAQNGHPQIKRQNVLPCFVGWLWMHTFTQQTNWPTKPSNKSKTTNKSIQKMIVFVSHFLFFSLSLFVLFSASWFVIPINSHSDVVAVLDSHNLAVVVGIVVVVVVVHPFSSLSDTLLRKVHPFVSNSLSTSSLHRSNEVNP